MPSRTKWDRLGEWWEGKVRPIPGNAPHDRPVSRGICPLRRICDDPFLATRFPLLIERTIPGARYAFLKAWRNLSGPMGFKQNPTLGPNRAASRRSARDPGKRAQREDHALSHRPQMSSGRLFLDQVGRHQSLSPLCRQADPNMLSANPWAKPELLTLQKTGSSHFALTHEGVPLDYAA